MALERRGSFADLDRKYRGDVFNLCFAILRNRDDAEDAVQATFEDLWREVDNIRDLDKISSWIRKVARNRSYDVARQRQRHTSRAVPRPVDPDASENALERLESGDARPDDLVMHSDLIATTRAAITTLPMIQQEVLELYRQGLALDEIAEITSERAGTVRSRLSRALVTLRELLKETGMEPGALQKRLLLGEPDATN